MSLGQEDPARPSQPSSRFSRRLSSVPRDLRNSFESVSARLHLSGARPASHSNSNSNSGYGNDLGHSRQAVSSLDIHALGSVMDDGSGILPRRSASQLGFGPTDPFSVNAPRRSASGGPGNNGDAVSLSSSHGSHAPTPGRWFERLRRNSNRSIVSKEIDTALEKANQAAAHRGSNPFLRKRSVASVISVTSITGPEGSATVGPRQILGCTPAQAAEVGGLASFAGAMLPPHLVTASRHLEVPSIVDLCLCYLLEHGALATPGLFRVSGSNAIGRILAEHFSDGASRGPLADVPLPGDQVLSVHDVASLVKKFLTMMPGGLLGEGILLDLQEQSEEPVERQSARQMAETLLDMQDPLQRAILQLQLGFLAALAEQSAALQATESILSPTTSTTTTTQGLVQERGYMTGKTLGIVFAPACLGTHGVFASGYRCTTPSTSGGGGGGRRTSHDVRSASPSRSDYSFQSDASTQIEEAVLQAKQAAKVVEMLIAHWSAIVPILDTLMGVEAQGMQEQDDTGEGRLRSRRGSEDYTWRHSLDETTMMAPTTTSGGRVLLDTILDSSPLKPPPVLHELGGDGRHVRTMSVDTVVPGCTCDQAKQRDSLRVQQAEARVAVAEGERREALAQLAQRTTELAQAQRLVQTLRRALQLAGVGRGTDKGYGTEDGLAMGQDDGEFGALDHDEDADDDEQRQR